MEWANVEGLSIREMEHHMDVDMFLDWYAGWEVGSPHCPIFLNEMTQPPKVGPAGGYICHLISGTSNQQGGVQGLVL